MDQNNHDREIDFLELEQFSVHVYTVQKCY